MSLLIFEQHHDSVLLVTDTLVSDENRQTVGYQHKVWELPHLRIVMAMTGTALVGHLWNERTAELFPEQSTPVDIDAVNAFAQVELAAAHAKVTAAVGPHGTSTIYMFGFDESDTLVRYIYRSARDYKPERFVGPAFALKPAPQSFTPAMPGTRDELIELAIKMRHENDNHLTPEPVAIGGELIATHLSFDGIKRELWYQFPD